MLSILARSAKTENARKKQYETDDFHVDTMPHEPVISQQSRPALPFSPALNHVQIDPEYGVHVHQVPHFEEPVPIHHEEEPVYVHHEEPPPPPPEQVLIPVPIAAPAPPPPPPPPCTVHIPVTIHLKGKLAIKVKHCLNCDFTKNIEAIGPLKIASINGLKGKLGGAMKAPSRRNIFQSTNDEIGTKRKRSA